MNTPSTPPQNTAPASASSSSPFPTGEAQVGVVAKPAARVDNGPEPVVEHRVAVPEPEKSEHASPSLRPAAPEAPAPAPAAAVAPAAPAPVAAAVQPAAAPALQESAPVPIPERMNQLHAENKRLRDGLESLEKALKKSLN